MITYKGLCIGGPMDGRFLEHHSQRFQAPQLPEAPAIFESNANPPMDVRHVDYHYVAVRPDWGFWSDIDPRDHTRLDKLLDKLVKSYSERTTDDEDQSQEI